MSTDDEFGDELYMDEMEGQRAEIARLREENGRLKGEAYTLRTALQFGGHLRPGDREPCSYVENASGICNKCGWTRASIARTQEAPDASD